MYWSKNIDDGRKCQWIKDKLNMKKGERLLKRMWRLVIQNQIGQCATGVSEREERENRQSKIEEIMMNSFSTVVKTTK